jgi:cytoskeletal protein RodZ
MGDAEDYPETGEQLTSAVDVPTQAVSAADVPTQAVSAADVPTQAAAPVELAWSREDAGMTQLLRYPWRLAWSRAGLVVLCGIVVAVALGAIGWQVFGPQAPAPPRPTTAPSVAVPAPATNNPTAAPPAIPPPAAPTIQAAPPAADPPTRSDDKRFLAMLSRDGIPSPTSVPDAVAAAADVCRMISSGDDFGYVESWMVPPRGPYTQDQSEAFVADAISAYCPHAALPR